MALVVWSTVALASNRWRTCLVVSIVVVVGVDAILGFISWIYIILKQGDIKSPLDSLSGVVLGRDLASARALADTILAQAPGPWGR